MRNFLFSMLLCVVLTGFFACSKGDKKTTVDDVCSLMEDITFMKYCYDNFDANKDGLLSQTEAASVYTIDISGLDIYSLAGIEIFTRLESIIAENCTKLREVIIPNTITSIGSHAFRDCTSLTSVTIPDSVTSIGSSAFRDCTSLTSVTIPDSVTSIGRYAFAWCRSLTSITIPDSVTSIGEYAFCGCSSLASIAIPDGITSIKSETFYGCSSLTSITIPESVTSIGSHAFRDCTSLTSVYCKPTTPPAGSSDMFNGNASGRKIYVPRNSVEAYKSAEYWKRYADYIVGYDF